MPILRAEAHRLLVGTRAFLTANKIRRGVIVGSDTAVAERFKDSLVDDVGAVSARLSWEVRDYLTGTPEYCSGHGDAHVSALSTGVAAVVSRAVMVETVAVARTARRHALPRTRAAVRAARGRPQGCEAPVPLAGQDRRVDPRRRRGVRRVLVFLARPSGSPTSARSNRAVGAVGGGTFWGSGGWAVRRQTAWRRAAAGRLALGGAWP